MTEERSAGETGRGWLRAAALFGSCLALSVVQPTVLVAVPFLALVAVFGMRGVGVAFLAAVAMIVAVGGPTQEPLWWVERGWALMVAGFFVAATFRRPESSLSSRALLSVLGASGVMGALLALRPEWWSMLDWMVRDRLSASIGTGLEALRVLQGGDALPSSLVTAVHGTVELQGDVFPATLALASMAALGVAWWAFRRATTGTDEGLAPLARFRFNDHLVWLFIGGLVLAVLRWNEVFARMGENLVTFMGALYAVRGAAVVLYLSGGLSIFGWMILALGLLFVSPLLLTGALVLGISDTWLDIRARAGDAPA